MSRSLLELLALTPPKIQYYIDPYILSYGGSLFIYGSPGTWKSWLAIDLAFSLCLGKPWIVYSTRKVSVMIIQSEQVESMYQERIQDFVKARPNYSLDELNKMIRFRSEQNMKLDSWSGLIKLEKEIIDWKPQVVIIDCLYRSVATTRDETAMMHLFDGLSRFQREFGTAFIIIHHPRKEKQDSEGETYDSGYDEMTGSGSISRWADTIIRVTHIQQAQHTIRLLFQKVKNRKRDDIRYDLRLQVDTDTITFKLV